MINPDTPLDLDDRARALYSWDARIRVLTALDEVQAALAAVTAERDEWHGRWQERIADLGRTTQELAAARAEADMWMGQLEELTASANAYRKHAAGATSTAAPKADPYPLVPQDFRDAVAKTAAERWPDKYAAAPKATFLPAVNSAGVGEGNCNCQAVKGTPNYPGPWHPAGDTPSCPTPTTAPQADDDLAAMTRAVQFAADLLRTERGPGGITLHMPVSGQLGWIEAADYLERTPQHPMIPLHFWRRGTRLAPVPAGGEGGTSTADGHREVTA